MLEHILRGNLLRGRKKKSRLRATELPEDNNVVFVHEMTSPLAPDWDQTGLLSLDDRTEPDNPSNTTAWFSMITDHPRKRINGIQALLQTNTRIIQWSE